MKTRKTADKRNLAPGEREERAGGDRTEEDGAPGRRVVISETADCVQTEKDLFEMAERYRLANKATNDVIWDWDIVNDAQRWNEAGSTVFGWTDIVEAPQTSAWWMDRVHPEDCSRVDQTFQAAVGDPAVDRWNAEYRFRKADGAYAFVVDRGYILRDADGRAVRMIGSMLDLTGRKQAEELLRSSEERYRKLVDNLDAGVVMHGPDTSVIFCNSRALELLGLSEDQIAGRQAMDPGWKFLHEDHTPVSLEEYPVTRIIAEKKAIKNLVLGNVRPVSKDIVWVSVNGIPVFDQQGNILQVVVSFVDITERKQAEEASKREQALTHAIIESIPGAFYMLDKCGRYVRWNAYQRDEIIGKPESLVAGTDAIDTIHPDDREFISAKIANVLEHGVHETVEGRVLLKGGPAFRWLLMTGRQMVVDGSPFLLGIGIDITERKAMELALASTRDRLLLATKAGGVGIWDWDIVNNILIWDDQMYLQYGITKDQFGGAYEAWVAGVHPEDKMRGDAEIQMAFRGEKEFDTEFRVLWPDGTIRNIRALALVQRDASGKPLRMIGTNWDITEIARTEKELKIALERAEESAAAKSEFLGIMSHELRTPLNGVLGFSELLADTPLDEEQKSCVETISNSGNHLLAIVNDILDFSSIEKGAMAIHVEPFAFAGLVKSSEQAVQKTALDKGLAFRSVIEPGVPEQISGDERRIRQILINLLGNAVKFTSNGSVTLRVATVRVEGRQFLDFSVEDTGIGMSPETMGLLFNPFTQADMKRNRTFGGTGLGLAISKRLAEAMGGTITVTSTPGKGSTFTFRLPLETSLPSSAPAASAPCDRDSSHSSGALVLVVEDDKTSITLIGKILQSIGYRAEFAVDGAEAVRTFEPGKFSAILMDMAMPVMDGIEATKIIRERESGSRIPIIALTANVMPGDRERCYAAGMDDFVSKPFKKDELAATLARVLRPPQ